MKTNAANAAFIIVSRCCDEAELLSIKTGKPLRWKLAKRSKGSGEDVRDVRVGYKRAFCCHQSETSWYVEHNLMNMKRVWQATFIHLTMQMILGRLRADCSGIGSTYRCERSRYRRRRRLDQDYRHSVEAGFLSPKIKLLYIFFCAAFCLSPAYSSSASRRLNWIQRDRHFW